MFNVPLYQLQEEDTGQPPPYPEAVIVMDIVGEEFYHLMILYFSPFFPFTLVLRNYIQDL